MAIASHVEELKKKHQQLNDAVEAAHRKPGFNSIELAQLKKKKLQLKEKLGKLGA